MKEVLQGWETLARTFAILGGTMAIALAGHYLIFKAIERLGKRTKTVFDASLVKHCSQPTRFLAILLAVSFVLQLLKIPPTVLDCEAPSQPLFHSIRGMAYHSVHVRPR